MILDLGIKPYFSTELGDLYHADCLDILPKIPDKAVDLVLTDPPYGIGASSKKFINGTSKTSKDYYEDICWDTATPCKEVFDLIVKYPSIIWGGNYFELPPTRCFLIWDKTIHGNSYADCEMAWTSFDKVARIKSINMVEANNDGRIHPTQKPLKLFKWCLKHYSKENDLILDPFSGSGTTAVACEDLRRRWICIEKEERYCQLSATRIENFLKQGKLF